MARQAVIAFEQVKFGAIPAGKKDGMIHRDDLVVPAVNDYGRIRHRKWVLVCVAGEIKSRGHEEQADRVKLICRYGGDITSHTGSDQDKGSFRLTGKV